MPDIPNTFTRASISVEYYSSYYYYELYAYHKFKAKNKNDYIKYCYLAISIPLTKNKYVSFGIKASYGLTIVQALLIIGIILGVLVGLSLI